MAKNNTAETYAEPADEFLDGITPNQWVNKTTLEGLGPFVIADITERHNNKYNRDEFVFLLDVVEDTSEQQKMVSFGKDNSYIAGFVKRWKGYKAEGKDAGMFTLKEVEKNRFRFQRPE